MTKPFADLITGAKGRLVPAITAFIMGGITQFVTSKGLELPGEVAVAISGMVAALTGWGFEFAAGRMNKQGAKAIQEGLPGIQPTGMATSPTVAMVARLTDRRDGKAPVRALTIAEGQAIKMHLYQICRDSPELLAELRKAVTAIEPEPPEP